MTDQADPSGPDGPAPAGLPGPLPPARRRRSVRGALVVVLLAAAAFAALYVGAAAVGPTAADVAVLDESVDLRTADLTAFATVLTNAGGTVSMAIVAMLVALWLVHRRRIPDAVLAFGAMAGAAALFTGLKDLIDRRRPPELGRLVHETNASLPSGHATMSVVVIGTLVVLAWAGLRILARVVAVAAAVVWVGAVGATRVYLGVHWSSDVVAGWLVGAAWLAACVLAWSWWHARRRSSPRPGNLSSTGPP